MIDTVTVAEAFWREFGGTITAVAQNDWNAIKGYVEGALTAIRGVINLFTGLIHGDWGQAWDGIKQIVSGVTGMIESTIQGLLANIESVFGGIAHSIWSNIQTGTSKALSFIKALPGDITKALGDLSTLLINAGEHLIEGLIKGIENKAGELYSKAKGIANDITGVFTSVWKMLSPSRVFMEIGQNLMAGLSIGIDTGSKTAIASLKTTLDKAKGALLADQPTINQAAQLLGVSATQGIVDGALGVQKTAAEQLKTALETAMTNALALTKDAPEIQTAASHIGEAAVQKVIDGVVGKKQTMADQIRAALTAAVQAAAQGVTAASSSFSSAFNSLGSGVLSQFDASNANFVAPATKQLNAMQLQDQVNQYHTAITQAAATLTTDQQALTAAIAGGNPATIQAAQAQIVADQAAYNAAVRAQQEFQLGQLATKQAAAHAEELADQREALAKQLANLRTELAKNPKEWDTMGQKVQAILKTYHVPLYQSGQKFAQQFASGIESQLAAVEAAAQKMAAAVAKYIPKSPAETGPLAFSSMAMGAKFGSDFAAGISQGLYGGAGLGEIASVFSSGLGTPTGALGASTAIGGGSGANAPTVNVYVQGFAVGTEEAFAEQMKYKIRDSLLTIGRTEASIFYGRA